MAAFKLHNFCVDLHLANPPIDQENTPETSHIDSQDQQEGRNVRRHLIENYFST